MPYIEKYKKKIRYFLVVNIYERFRLFTIRFTRIFFYKHSPKQNIKIKKFIFNVQYIWAFSELELMSAAQLKQLGHEVIILICDEMPYTEIEIIGQEKPSYKSYFNRAKRYCKAYGLDYVSTSSYLSNEDRSVSKKISSYSIDDLLELSINNIKIGEISKRNHAHYFKGDIYPSGNYELVFRKIIESALLIEKSVSKIVSKYHDYDLVTANGKFIQTAIPAEINKNAGNNFYTYEVFGQGNGVILDKNKCSMEQRIDDYWDELKSNELNPDELKRLYYSFELQEKSQSSKFDLWDENRIDDKEKIINILNLDLSKKIISCYPNVYWDSTHMGLEGVSKDLTSWLVDMIRFVKDNRDIQLIVRTHPGELRVPEILQSKYTIIDSIKRNMAEIPSNVFLIEPENNISSYSLAEIANINIVWNGTIGIEFALRDIKPIVVADAYYAKKGFTYDINSFKELESFILEINNKSNLVLTAKEKKLAEIFAYHIRFNRKFNPPNYIGSRCILFNYLNTCIGKNSTLDSMVGFFLDNNSYLNIGKFNFDNIT